MFLTNSKILLRSMTDSIIFDIVAIYDSDVLHASMKCLTRTLL